MAGGARKRGGPASATALAAGDLTVRTANGTTSKLLVTGGFFEVSNNRASVLADSVTGAVQG